MLDLDTVLGVSITRNAAGLLLLDLRAPDRVTVDRGATRFCPNMHEHCHFYCDTCEKVFDIDLSDEDTAAITLPKGFKASRFEIAIHGVCAKCADQSK